MSNSTTFPMSTAAQAPQQTGKVSSTSRTNPITSLNLSLRIVVPVVFYSLLATFATLLSTAIAKLGDATAPNACKPRPEGGDDKEHVAALEDLGQDVNRVHKADQSVSVAVDDVTREINGLAARAAIASELGSPSPISSHQAGSPLLGNALLFQESLSDAHSTGVSSDHAVVSVDSAYPSFSASLVSRLYAYEKELGEGGQGVVNLCQHSVIGAVAVKFFTKKYRAQGLDECRSLIRFRNHPNIVSIHDAFFEDGDRLAIAMEFVSETSLDDMVPTKPKFVTQEMPDAKLGGISNQLFSALAYLHANNVVHRDIKPSNVMITDDGLIKLVDFGLATQTPVAATPHWVGTLPYLAPELIQLPSVDYGCAADIWSTGCLLLQLADSLLLRRTYDDEGEVQAWLRSDSARRPRVRSANKRDTRAVDFIKSCLVWDQYTRPTAEELLEHAFLTEVACQQSEIMGLGNFDHWD